MLLRKRGVTEIIYRQFSILLQISISCDPSLEPSCPDGSNEGSQHIFYGEIRKIIFELSLLPLLTWSTVTSWFTLMGLNTGTLKTIIFSFGTNGKLIGLGLQLLKHFQIFNFKKLFENSSGFELLDWNTYFFIHLFIYLFISFSLTCSSFA